MRCDTHRKERTSGKSSQVMRSHNMALHVISNGNLSRKGLNSRKCLATTSAQVTLKQSRYSTTGISTAGYLRNPVFSRYWLSTPPTSSKRTSLTICPSPSSLRDTVWMQLHMPTRQWLSSSTLSTHWKISRSEQLSSSNRRTRNLPLPMLRRQLLHRVTMKNRATPCILQSSTHS